MASVVDEDVKAAGGGGHSGDGAFPRCGTGDVKVKKVDAIWSGSGKGCGGVSIGAHTKPEVIFKRFRQKGMCDGETKAAIGSCDEDLSRHRGLMAGAGEPGGLSLVRPCVRCDDSVVTDTSSKKFASKDRLPAAEDGKAVAELRLEGESGSCPGGKRFSVGAVPSWVAAFGTDEASEIGSCQFEVHFLNGSGAGLLVGDGCGFGDLLKQDVIGRGFLGASQPEGSGTFASDFRAGDKCERFGTEPIVLFRADDQTVGDLAVVEPLGSHVECGEEATSIAY